MTLGTFYLGNYGTIVHLGHAGFSVSTVFVFILVRRILRISTFMALGNDDTGSEKPNNTHTIAVHLNAVLNET